MRAQLIDGHKRSIGDVRISVTDRCNFRCQYCMPAEGLPWLDRDELLSYEEIARLVGLMASMGVHDVRLTGGEPLARRELWRLVELLSGDENVHDLSLTTNGYLLRRQLPDLVAAGLKRLNVSLDALAPDRFFELTRRDALDEVLAGLEAAEAYPQLRPIKVNAVALRDFTEAEAGRFAELARKKPYEVRFIEWMPLDATGSWTDAAVVGQDEIVARIDAVFPLEPMPARGAAPADRWRYRDGGGTVGVIPTVTKPFCGDCDRVRLTADGQFRTCLFATDETDLRAAMRAGASDDDLARRIESAVGGKWAGHRIHQVDFVRPRRSMSQIGG